MAAWVSRGLLIVLGCTLALALVEGVLRLLPTTALPTVSTFREIPDDAWRDPDWMDIPWRRGFRAHPVIGYQHATNADIRVRQAEHSGGEFRFKTNNLGLRRDANTAVEKPAGVLRVLVLGDSHTDGIVDNGESFASMLESLLNGSVTPGTRVEVLNAGVVGYSPAEQYLWYQQNGVRLSPDAVISVFYAGNDALDLLNPIKANVDPSTGNPRPPGGPSPSDLGEMKTIRAARALSRAAPLAALWERIGITGVPADPPTYSNDVLISVLRRCFGCYFQGLQQAAHAHHDEASLLSAVHGAATMYDRWRQAAQTRGTHLAVAVLPTRVQVEPDLARSDQSAVAQLLGLGGPDLTFDDRVADSLLDDLERGAVPRVDLRSALVEAGGQPRYYSVDWHLNPLGHRLVAAELARSLDLRPTAARR